MQRHTRLPTQTLLLALLLLLSITTTFLAEAFLLSPKHHHLSLPTRPSSIPHTRRQVAYQDNNKKPHHQQHNKNSPSSTSSTISKEDEDLLATLESKYFTWKGKYEIHYVEAGSPSSPPLLLLPGFGVSSFHYERNIHTLAQSHHVFAIDYLGQGKSWPGEDPQKEDELVFSVEMWHEQIITFIKEVIKEPVYISGNSLGGFLAVTVAALHPEWVKGCCCTNATPFWGFAPHRKKMSEWVKKTIIPYDGVLPAPRPLFEIGARYYGQLRNERTVKAMLGMVYSNENAFGDRLVNQIIEPTSNKHGESVFTSILFAPKPEHSFEEYLDKMKAHKIPLLMLYGKEDPWITPAWGQRLKRFFPEAVYYEVSPSGHCPAHETPVAVNALMLEWMEGLEEAKQQKEQEGKESASVSVSMSKSKGEGKEDVRRYFEPVTGTEVTATLMDGQPRDWMEWLVANTIFR